MDRIEDFIAGPPKAELHVHIEGTLEPDLKLKLAQRNHLELPESTVADVQATYDAITDLPSFLKVYYPAMRVLVTVDDFRDLAYAYLRRAAPRRMASSARKSSSIPRHTPGAGFRSTQSCPSFGRA